MRSELLSAARVDAWKEKVQMKTASSFLIIALSRL
jgi:hypothetical protein